MNALNQLARHSTLPECWTLISRSISLISPKYHGVSPETAMTFLHSTREYTCLWISPSPLDEGVPVCMRCTLSYSSYY